MKIYGQPEKNVRQAAVSGDATIAICGLGKTVLPLAVVFADAGGHCIPVYPYFIIHAAEVSTSMLKLACRINDTILIASDRAGFKEIDWGMLDRRMRHKVVVDKRSILDLEELCLRGYLCWAVG